MPCIPSQFCDDPNIISYRPDYNFEGTYDNWVEKLDLTCRSDRQIGLIGSSTAVGQVISLTLAPRLTDLLGRQKIMIVGLCLQAVSFAVIMLTREYWVAVEALFAQGIFNTMHT